MLHLCKFGENRLKNCRRCEHNSHVWRQYNDITHPYNEIIHFTFQTDMMMVIIIPVAFCWQVNTLSIIALKHNKKLSVVSIGTTLWCVGMLIIDWLITKLAGREFCFKTWRWRRCNTIMYLNNRLSWGCKKFIPVHRLIHLSWNGFNDTGIQCLTESWC